MDRWKVGLLGTGAVVAALGAAHGQGANSAPSPYFDCPYVNYFDRDCPQLRKLWEEQERRRLQGQGDAAVAPHHPEPTQPEEQERANDDRRDDLDAGETYLLFPKESLAPDAPPLFRLLLAEPTLENARRYVRWYARRTARLQAVQALIKLAGGELEASAKAGGEVQ